MKEKQKYQCSFCGTEYDSAPARARCELECDEKRKQEVERLKQKLLEGKRQERYREIKEKNDNLNRMIVQYNKDYGDTLVSLCSADLFQKLFFW